MSFILKENKYVFYNYCFVHQCQLAFIVVAKNHVKVVDPFKLITIMINIVDVSTKRIDILRWKHDFIVFETLTNREISIDQGLNKETNLKRLNHTR